MFTIRLDELHPIIVHFPIALLLTSVALDLLGAIFPRWRLNDLAAILLMLGVPSELAAILAGNLSEHLVHTPTADSVLHLHKIFAFSSGGLFGVLFLARLAWVAPRLLDTLGLTAPRIASYTGALSHGLYTLAPAFYRPTPPRALVALYLAVSIVAVALLAITGYLGGSLVYDHGVAAPVAPAGLLPHLLPQFA